MVCPNCKSETRVIDSRRTNAGDTRRRRECPICAVRFTTYERRVVPDQTDPVKELDRLRHAVTKAASLINPFLPQPERVGA